MEKKSSDPVLSAIKECDFFFLGKLKVTHASICSMLVGIGPLYLGLIMASLDSRFVYSGWNFFIFTFFLPILYLLSQFCLLIILHPWQEKYVRYHARLIEQEAKKALLAQALAGNSPATPSTRNPSRSTSRR